MSQTIFDISPCWHAEVCSKTVMAIFSALVEYFFLTFSGDFTKLPTVIKSKQNEKHPTSRTHPGACAIFSD
jgi:hypothetical protein